MSASLKEVGKTQLGKVGSARLSELNSSDSETRDFSTYGYLRVNSFEQADGDAPTPADQPGAGGNARLSDWDGYVQWTASRGTGSAVDCTSKDWDSLNFNWSQPANYGDFPSTEVQQQLWCKKCTDQTQAGCEDESPLDGTAYATTDGTTAGTGNVLDFLSWYICSVVMNWDDDGDVGWERESDLYAADSTPTNGFDNIDSIIVETDNTTTTTPACLDNGESCSTCPDETDCCSGWCDGIQCVSSEPNC